MPWFTCSRCRIRRSGLDVAITAAQDRCPLCGRPLEAVSDLASLMGSRFLTNDVLSAHVGDVSASSSAAGSAADRNAASDAFAADRWLDEGGSAKSGR
jgi:hypothetical protein